MDGQGWDDRGSAIDYGAEIDPSDMWRLLAYREHEVVVCDGARSVAPVWWCAGEENEQLWAWLDQFLIQPGRPDVWAWIESQGLDCVDATTLGRRYVYVTALGPSRKPLVSVEAAVEAYLQTREAVANHPRSITPGGRLGHLSTRYPVESPHDAMVVLPWSVTVIDGMVRGLAQNHSERLWARDVAVTATDPSGVEHTWRYPLAVQPFETMPFEIEGWTGSQSPSEIDLRVSAEMSPRIDLTRSLDLTWFNYHREIEEWIHKFPEEMVGSEIPDDFADFYFTEVRITRAAPTAQPRLAQAALEQTIEDLVVYAAVFNDGVLSDVLEMTPMTKVSVHTDEWVEVFGIGVEQPGFDIPIRGAVVGALLEYTSVIEVWAGGAA